jgi:chitinase
MLFVGYFQSWSEGWAADGSQTTLARLPAYVNVVNLSFMRPDSTYVAGSLNLSTTGLDVPYDGATLKAAVSALHSNQPGTRVMISVGGATYTNWAAFNATAVSQFVSDFGLDGADIDYEPASPNCTVSGGSVSCPSDSEFISTIRSMRQAMASPKWLSIAAFSVGAYGEGAWANAPPASNSTGLVLAVLKDAQAAAALDLVNIMAYDASDAFSPQQALAAYQHYFPGRVTLGIEVPPEAWGGHVATLAEIDTLAAAVASSHAAGLMLWSLQKSDGPTQQFSTEICNQLGLSHCTDLIP